MFQAHFRGLVVVIFCFGPPATPWLRYMAILGVHFVLVNLDVERVVF